MTKLPNIAFSGTPGTGKSTLSKKLAKAVPGFTLLDFGKEAQRRHCRIAYDEELQTWEINERKLAKKLRPELAQGGCILDWIHADHYTKDSKIDLVVTMRARTDVLHDRLKERSYSDGKIAENMDSEIFEVILEENRDRYPGGSGTVIMELRGDDESDLEKNLDTLQKWITTWTENGGRTEDVEESDSEEEDDDEDDDSNEDDDEDEDDKVQDD